MQHEDILSLIVLLLSLRSYWRPKVWKFLNDGLNITTTGWLRDFIFVAGLHISCNRLVQNTEELKNSMNWRQRQGIQERLSTCNMSDDKKLAVIFLANFKILFHRIRLHLLTNHASVTALSPPPTCRPTVASYLTAVGFSHHRRLCFHPSPLARGCIQMSVLLPWFWQ